MDTIIQNLKHVQQRIDEACKAAGRDPKEVKLLLATKTVSPERIQQALAAGYTLIAEIRYKNSKEKSESSKIQLLIPTTLLATYKPIKSRISSGVR